MTTATARIVALGVTLRPLEPIPVVGALLGWSRATAFRRAASWPTTGCEGERRRVIVTQLLEQLGIPYSVASPSEVGGTHAHETPTAADHGPTVEHAPKSREAALVLAAGEVGGKCR